MCGFCTILIIIIIVIHVTGFMYTLSSLCLLLATSPAAHLTCLFYIQMPTHSFEKNLCFAVFKCKSVKTEAHF